MVRNDVRETVHCFGPGNALLGVLSRPSNAGADAGDLAVIVLNAGIVHRIGPNRIHVRLARQLASRGVNVLRFDLPAIGDSGSIGAGGNPHEEALAAIRAACDSLCTAGIASRFVLFGICSGAAQSIRGAFDDLRVVGAVAIDPPALFPTRLHRVMRPARKGLSLMRWKKLLTGGYKLTRRLLGKHRPRIAAPVATTEQVMPDPGDMYRVARDVLSELSRRDVRLLIVFTGDRADTYSYRRQLFDALPKLGLERTTTVQHYPDSAHTFPREIDRQRFEADLRDWIATVPSRNVVARRELPRVAQAAASTPPLRSPVLQS